MPELNRPLVELSNVHKAFGAVEVLKGISMDVEAGSVVCIIGPSGSGKSTILRCINGLVPINSGFIRVGHHQVQTLRNDKMLVPLRHDVAMVFQQYNLFPHKTVLQNIMMAPIQVLKRNRTEVRALAERLLSKVQLADRADAYPGQLSGGQQQRVAIARALAMEPKVMLFDEVTAALDPEMVNEVLGVIKEVAAEGMTCILVTHEMRFAEDVADQIYFTDKGVIVEHAAPKKLLHDPTDPRLREFLDKVF